MPTSSLKSCRTVEPDFNIFSTAFFPDTKAFFRDTKAFFGVPFFWTAFELFGTGLIVAQ